jgi:hypothetical protein
MQLSGCVVVLLLLVLLLRVDAGSIKRDGKQPGVIRNSEDIF